MSDSQRFRRLDDVTEDDEAEDLNFRDQRIVSEVRVLPTTATLPPPPPAPKIDS